MSRDWFTGLRGDNDGITRKFSYESLQIATKNFSKDMLIGKGSNGKVYKGTLSNGTAVAVKVSRKDEYLFHGCWEEFLPMVEVMSHIRHRNIVQVIGFCIDKDSLLLVTKYASNGCLLELLQDPVKKESSIFNWDSRAAICIGIARGLTYIHTEAIPHIVHLDIKPSNIVLDHSFTPKIIDFDGSKFIDELKESETYEALVTGTLGYVDPVYCRTGEYSHKSDVYSFGVVMLEIISGKICISRHPDGRLTNALPKHIAHGKDLEIIDPVLTDVATDEAKSFIDVAFLCIQDDPKRRPSMLEVWQMLYGVCNSSRLFITRPHKSLLTLSGGGKEDEQEHSTSVNVLNLNRHLNPEAEDTTNEGQSLIFQSEEHSTGVNLLARTRTSNPVGGQSSISLSSTAETSTAQKRLHPVAFKKQCAKNDFPEAVYPPFLTSVYRRRGSIGFQGSYTRTFFP